MNLINDFILKKYIKIVLGIYHREHTSNNKNKHNLRCNICGDGKKNTWKKSGWFLDYKDKYRFKCFNCAISVPADRWLQKFYPEYYLQYIQETALMNNNTSYEPKVEVKKEVKNDQTPDVKYFRAISKNLDHELSIKSIVECNKRKIHNKYYDKWYISIDGKYKNRLIIPIFDKDNKIEFFQGRALSASQSPKYLNCMKSNDYAITAQLSVVDKSKPIIIVEGYIDSLFIENSVATLSTNWSDEVQKELDKLDCYYLIDFDKGNEEVQKRQIALLGQNKYLFNWYKYLREKNLENRSKWDINELILFWNKNEPFIFEDFKEYFTNNFLDKIYFIQ